ncbi:MAG TPA: AraC family transcriptional regulator, partial [Bacteroidota bacterium]|nr:AraC family transcriptional regulator [Bacteroidota bacterium]
LQQLSFASNAKNLTGVAYDCGYYDQSHFIREFKDFAGITPTKYLSETRTLNNLKVRYTFAED